MKKHTYFALALFLFSTSILFAEIEIVGQSKRFDKTPAGTQVGDLTSTLNTNTGETLITWLRDPHGPSAAVIGKIVNAQGRASKQLTLVSCGSNSAVAYNPTMNEYLIACDVYFATTDESHVVLQRLAADGSPIGTQKVISRDPLTDPYNANGAPELIFDPTTGGYILYWFVLVLNDIKHDSFNVRLSLDRNANPAGKLKKADFYATPDPFAWPARFLFTPSGRTFLAFGALIEQQNGDYFLTKVNAARTGGTSTKLNKKPVTDPHPIRKLYVWGLTLDFLPDGTAAAYYTDNNSVKGRRLSKTGKLTGPPFTAFQSPKNKTQLYWPSVTFINTSKGPRGILVATEDDELNGNAIVWAQLLNEVGKPVGAPVQIFSTTKTASGIITSLPEDALSDSFRFVWYGLVETQIQKVELRIP